MKPLGRKVLVIVLAAATVLSLCAVSVFGKQEVVGIGTVTGKLLRIRSDTSISSPVSATLDHGTKLSVLEKSGDWYRVQYDDVIGYVMDNCLSCVNASYDMKTTGLITADSAAVRADTSISSKKLNTVQQNAEVNVIGFVDGWYTVMDNGQVGYIRSDSLTLNGKPEPPPAPVKEVKKAEKKDDNTGTVTANDVCLRSKAKRDPTNVITSVNKGDCVTILKKLDGWYKVNFGDHEGYVSSDYVSLTASNIAEKTTTEKKVAKKTDSAKKAKKTNSSKAASSSDTSIIAVGIVQADGVRIRKKGNTDSEIINALNQGDVVAILGEKNGWYRVNYDNRNGYMSADYVNAKTSTKKLSTYGMVLADLLNMRQKPNADSKKLAAFANGVYLDITGFENGWYKVSYDDYSGYVSGDYITLSESKPAPPEPSSSGNSGSGSTGSSSSGRRRLPSGKSGQVGASSSEIVNYAEQFLGVPYVYGGASPSGFDCSGFVMYVFQHFGCSMPHGATDQLYYGSEVSRGNLQAGDIVFFQGTSSASAIATHCGIYIGGGQFIHASSGSSSYCVTISDLGSDYYSQHYLTARRIG